MSTPTASSTVISHDSYHLEGDIGKPRKGTDNKDVQLTDQTNLLPFRKILIVFLGLASCIVVTSLDSTIVATALPTVSSFFNAGAVSSWVPSASLLTSTAFQPLYGRFSDIFGRKITLCVAMALFVIGSLGAGLSRSMVELIIFRGVSGAGGGGIITLGQVVVSDVVSLRDRGKYQGIIGGVNTFGYAVGPLIGGVLAQKVSWRWCFWITIPISVAATVIVIFVLPLKPVHGDIKQKLLVVDYIGAMLTLLGCTLVLLPIIWGGVTFSWTSLQVTATLFGGLSVMIIFCLWEWKGATLPIVPMYIFRFTTVTGVYITMFIFGFVYWSSLFYIPQFFQTVLGYSPIHSGIFLLPILVSQTLASFLAGLAVSRTGRYRAIVLSGFTTWSTGLGCLSTLNRTTRPIGHVIFMLLCGVGAGQTQQTTIVAAQASVPRSDMSVVTAVRNFVRFIGGTLSLAVCSSIINNSLISAAHGVDVSSDILRQITKDPTLLSRTGPHALDITATERAAILKGYTSGFRIVFILNACLTALAVVVAYFMIQHKELTREDDAQRKAKALQEVEMETRRSRKAGIDEERNAVVVQDSSMTLAAVHMERKHTWFPDTKRMNEVQFSSVLPDSTTTLSVDDVEGKEMRSARTQRTPKEWTSTIVPASTATVAVDDASGMGFSRSKRGGKERLIPIVLDSAVTLAVGGVGEMRSAPTRWAARKRFSPAVSDTTGTLTVEDVEEVWSAQTKWVAKESSDSTASGRRATPTVEDAEDVWLARNQLFGGERNHVRSASVTQTFHHGEELRRARSVQSMYPKIDTKSTLAADDAVGIRSARPNRVAKDTFHIALRRDSTTILPVAEADYEKDEIGYYHS